MQASGVGCLRKDKVQVCVYVWTLFLALFFLSFSSRIARFGAGGADPGHWREGHRLSGVGTPGNMEDSVSFPSPIFATQPRACTLHVTGDKDPATAGCPGCPP